MMNKDEIQRTNGGLGSPVSCGLVMNKDEIQRKDTFLLCRRVVVW